MKNIDELLDHVKNVAGITSDRKLSERLELSINTAFEYRKRGKLPSDETMLKLAELGNIDPDDALLMLNVWRTTGEAKKRYLHMLKRTAIVLIAFLTINTAFLAPAPNALINNDIANIIHVKKGNNVMIIRLCDISAK